MHFRCGQWWLKNEGERKFQWKNEVFGLIRQVIIITKYADGNSFGKNQLKLRLWKKSKLQERITFGAWGEVGNSALKRDEKAVQCHTELIFAVSSLLTSTPSSVLSIPRKSDIRPMYDSRALFSLVYGGRNLKKRWDHWAGVCLIYSQFNHCRFYQRRRNRICLIISAKTFWSDVNDRQWGVVTCWQKSKRRRSVTKEK